MVSDCLRQKFRPLIVFVTNYIIKSIQFNQINELTKRKRESPEGPSLQISRDMISPLTLVIPTQTPDDKSTSMISPLLPPIIPESFEVKKKKKIKTEIQLIVSCLISGRDKNKFYGSEDIE